MILSELNYKAIEIDKGKHETDGYVNLKGTISVISAVHARGALEKVINDVGDCEDNLWITWPLRVVIEVLNDAIDDRET